MLVDGKDCGYLGPPDVACSEYRAAHWTGRCDDRRESQRPACLEWHARWATRSCYPNDEYLEAHVRWAAQRCRPDGADASLTRPAQRGEAASGFVEQYFR